MVRAFLRVDPADVEAATPWAIIVGEAPGPNTRPDCPVFPWPPRSAGGRLLAYSGLDARTYLRSFHRVNLLTEFPGHRWPRQEAEATAQVILMAAVVLRRPLVLLGLQVARAFGWPEEAPILQWRWSRWQGSGHRPAWSTNGAGPSPLDVAQAVRIPHPSGRSRTYNDPTVRERVREVLRQAITRGVPSGTDTRAD